jgi:hypothetical protein
MVNALGHGERNETSVVLRCTKFPPGTSRRGSARAPTVRAVYGVCGARHAACTLSGTSFHATLRSFPIGFLDNHLDNSARLNQISANQISANEQKRVKPGIGVDIGVTNRPRVVDRNDAENWKRSASRSAQSQQRRPNPSRTDVRPARAHMMFRDVQCHVGRQPPPPKARHFAQRKVAAPAPTMSQTSRQPTAQKRPPPSR